VKRREFLLTVPALLVATPARAVPELDQPAPPLKGKFFSGEAFDVSAMRGKVVLLNFYSSYCKFCAYEIGNLETFQEQYRTKGFEAIVLGVDSPEDRHRVERMTRLYNLRATMVYELESNGFGRRYPTPTAFVVDREGTLRVRIAGAKTPRRFSEEVIPLLS
jgi:cytochrome c biogenesis protein CcmG, thiol:disulfide interchange protein DsbE